MSEKLVRIGPIAGTGSAAVLQAALGHGQSALLYVVHVANTTTTNQTFKFSIGADAAGTRLFGDSLVEANGGVVLVEWGRGIPITDADTIEWTAATTLTVTITLGLVMTA